MILLNFNYPVSAEQRSTIEEKVSGSIDEVVDIPIYFDNDQSFPKQAADLFANGEIPFDKLLEKPVLVNLPSHSFIAALILAELHGRMGRFPAVVRYRPEDGSLPVRYEVSEVVDLQRIRDAARGARH
jgi:hypothetical protein